MLIGLCFIVNIGQKGERTDIYSHTLRVYLELLVHQPAGFQEVGRNQRIQRKSMLTVGEQENGVKVHTGTMEL